MSAIVKEVYDAFLEAGVSEAKASDAAKAIADDDARFNKIEIDLSVLKWMVAFNLAFTMAVLWKAFS